MSGTLHSYLWIAITGGIFGFVYNFGIGANDVANAFATSVASKSVTLPQAVAIASVFEFCGVLFLGASVTSTVRGKIFNTSDYEEMPEVVMLGMFTSLVSASFMMMVATYCSMPVSTTHTVIGCIIGFAVSNFMLHIYLGILPPGAVGLDTPYSPSAFLRSFIFSQLRMVYTQSIGMKQKIFSFLG